METRARLLMMSRFLVSGMLTIGCSRQSDELFPAVDGGATTPAALLRDWCTSMSARDRSHSLSLMRWSTKYEADMHQVLFLDKDEFFRVVPTFRNDIKDLDASYSVFKTFERGLQKLAEDVRLALDRGDAVVMTDHATATFDPHPEVPDDASHVKQRPLDLRRVRGRWYIWDMSCHNYTPIDD